MIIDFFKKRGIFILIGVCIGFIYTYYNSNRKTEKLQADKIESKDDKKIKVIWSERTEIGNHSGSKFVISKIKIENKEYYCIQNLYTRRIKIIPEM